MGTIADAETARLVERAKMERRNAGPTRDQIELFYKRVREIYDAPPLLTLGNGETVPRAYVQMHARALFFATLHRLVPCSTSALLSEEAYKMVKAQATAWRGWGAWVEEQHKSATLDPQLARYGFSFPPLKAAYADLADHIDRWKDDHGLHADETSDDWVANAAHLTLTIAATLNEHDEDYAYPVSVADPFVTVHDGKGNDMDDDLESGILRYTPTHKLENVPVYLDDLKYPPLVHSDGYDIEDEGEIGAFDPNSQTIDQALQALIPSLETRLRRVLEQIEADDRELNGNAHPVRYRDATVYEWLVRSQVLRQDKRDIAEAEGLSRDRIAKGINETAAWIGLTLRRERTGRKPGSKDTKPRHIGDRM